MKISQIRREETPEGVRISAWVERHRKDRDPFELYFSFDGLKSEDVDGSADPFAAALLIKAMRSNEPLEIAPPISHRLHIMLPRIRDIYHAWWPQYFHRVAIHSKPRPQGEPLVNESIGTFFSGGVDSFYSLLKHYQKNISKAENPLSHLVFMRGIETPLSRIKGIETSEEWVRAVADNLGVKTVFGSTNIRAHVLTHWEKYDHGSALAAVALCLSPSLGLMCIPSAFSYNHLIAHGSSPLTDEMFSSDKMFIFHDGAEVTRAEKVEAIVKWDKKLALQYLRVCLNNHGGAYNCGECRKCVRTAVPLQVMGVANERPIFQCETTEHWEPLLEKDHLELLRENLDFAKKYDPNSAITNLLDRALRKRKFQESVNQLRKITLSES